MSENMIAVAAIANAVPLGFIAFLFVSMSRRLDHMTTRIDRLYELYSELKRDRS